MTSTELELMKERSEDHVFDDTNLQTEERRGRSSCQSKLQDVVEKLHSLCMTRHEITSSCTGSPEPQRNDHQYCYIDETQELHEEVKMLSAKLAQREAMIVSSMAVIRALEKEVLAERRVVQARENEVLNLEKRVEALAASNQMLQSMMNLKMTTMESIINLKKTTAMEPTEETDVEKKTTAMESMMTFKETTVVEPMEEKESMMDVEKKTATDQSTMNDLEKKSAMESIEGELLYLAAIANTQNACVVRLSLQNEFLHRKLLEASTHFAASITERDAAISALEQFKKWAGECEFKLRAYDALLERSADFEAVIAERDAAVCALEQFKRRMLEWAGDYELLRAYALGLEGDLREYRFVFHTLEEVRRERDGLVREVEERESVVREREEEVESVGREALRVSLEVELLRRNVRQLEEDVLFKEGQISILRGQSCWTRVELVEGTSAY